MKSSELGRSQFIQIKGIPSSRKGYEIQKIDTKVSAQVMRSIPAGENTEFSIQGKLVSVKSLFRLFRGEWLDLVSKNSSASTESRWQVVRRVFIHTVNTKTTNSRSNMTENVSRQSLPQGIQREGFIQNAIESILKNATDLQTIQDSKIFKILDSLYPFMDWGGETEVLEWLWEDSVGNGYLSSSKDMTNFVLQYSSKNMGNSRFLFQIFHESKDWNLFASFESQEFYEFFLEKQEDIRSEFQSVHKLPTVFMAEFASQESIRDTQGWIA